MSSIVSESPSFSSHSFNSLVDIADRVVQELRTENCFNDDDDNFFDFSSNDNIGSDEDLNSNNIRTEMAKKKIDSIEDEQEFEFPVVCGKPNSSPISPNHDDQVSSEIQILPQYPLFDRSLLLEIDPDFSNTVDCSEIESVPSPVTRLSLRKLFNEERDSTSSSSSEADDLDRITPGSYCVWKPNTESQSRGNHKKSYSIGNNISKRWKVRDLLKRSYSDDNYSTGNGKDTPAIVLFTPPITNNEKVKKIEKSAKVVSAIGDGSSSSSSKSENNIPVHKSKAGGNRRPPPYLPYRQDQLGVFAHFNGSSRNLYRY